MVRIAFSVLFYITTISILVFLFFKIKEYFDNTVDGFSHYQKRNNYLLSPVLLILLISILLSLYYFFGIKASTLNIKIFSKILGLVVSASCLNFLILYLIYKLLFFNLSKEGYLLLGDSDETFSSSSEFNNSILKKEYFRIAYNYVILLSVVYFIFLLFPTTIVEKDIKLSNNSQIGNLKRSLVRDAQLKYGDKWFEKMYEDRNNYIKKYGYKKYLEIFGSQLNYLELEFKDYELKQKIVEMEK
jgi:hypothetical protein